MRKILLLCTLLLCNYVNGQNRSVQNVRAENVKVHISNKETIGVNLTLKVPASVKIISNRILVITPIVRNGNQEALFTPIYIYGREREIISKRKHHQPIEGSQVLRRKKGKDQVMNYISTIPYKAWMKGGKVILEQETCGCGNKNEETASELLVNIPNSPEIPEIQYCIPTNEIVKRRVYKGVAYIDFPVNKTVIYREYRKNPIELARIHC